MKRVLFIGGPANISSHCAVDLLAKGFEVSIFTRSTGRDDYKVAPQCAIHLGDRGDKAALAKAITAARPEVIIDFCCFHPRELAGLLPLLPGNLEQFIFISTVDVYGYPLSKRPMGEYDTKNAPNCAYARDKRACEQLLRQSGVSAITTIVRPAYSMGPRFALTALSRSGGLTLVPRLRQGLPVLSPDKGQRLLHAGSAKVAGRMIARLTGEAVALGQDYTVAAPQAVPYDTYLGLFAKALGVTPETVHIPTPAIYDLADYTIYEENLLFDLTSHDVSFSVDKFRADFPDFEWVWPLDKAIAEYIAYQDSRGGFKAPAEDLESLIIRRWQAKQGKP